jgi:hypothetical protein
MKINTSVALKAGLIGAAAAAVFSIIVNLIATFLGPLVCLVVWISPLIAVAAGVLYVYFSAGKVELAEGALGGALAGAIAGAGGALAGNLVAIIFQGAGIGSLFLGLIGGIIGGAVGGAIGGLVYSLIKK